MASSNVQLGVWTNWQDDRLRGLTLTLQPQHGFLLISAISLLVSFAGTQLWDIISFALHQLHSHNGDTDGLHHQLQMVLRTGLTSGKTGLALIKIGWRWRENTLGPIRRTLVLVTVAVTHLVLVTMAALYSSKIAGTSDMVLLRSKSCGWLDQSFGNPQFRLHTSNATQGEAMLAGERAGVSQSLEYAKACYAQSISSNDTASRCRSYVAPRIESKINRTALCPFSSQVCLTSALSLDSGYIDSNEHLGINSKPSERARVRRQTTCAPLMADKYDHGWAPSSFPTTAPNGTLFRTISYGPALDGTGNQNVAKNYTVAYSYPWRQFNRGYALISRSVYAENITYSDIMPLPEFSRSDADIALLLLVNNVSYVAEVKDPFFKANTSSILRVPEPLEVWTSDSGSTAIGCIEQYQFCAMDSCTALGGLFQTRNEVVEKIKPQGIQRATLELLFQAAWRTRTNWFATIVGEQMLVAKDRVLVDDHSMSPISSALEDDQWMIEVQNIHNSSLALLQRHVIDHVLPPGVTVGQGGSLSRYIVPESDEASLQLCKRQAVRDSSYQSFSVSGLLALFSLSLFIILAKRALPRIVQKLQIRTGRGLYRMLDWIQSDPLVLQRAAIQAQGIGPWEGAAGQVPITTTFNKRFSLNLASTRNALRSQNSFNKPLLEESAIELSKNIAWEDTETHSLRSGIRQRHSGEMEDHLPRSIQ